METLSQGTATTAPGPRGTRKVARRRGRGRSVAWNRLLTGYVNWFLLVSMLYALGAYLADAIGRLGR